MHLVPCVLILVMEGRKIMIRTYSELMSIDYFEERFDYLKLKGQVGIETFGYDRYLNQLLYRSRKWRDLRDHIIIRDDACDLAMDGYQILGRIVIHHMNPISIEDIENERSVVFDPEFLICTSHITHNAIHYGDESLLIKVPKERKPFDTCPWK